MRRSIRVHLVSLSTLLVLLATTLPAAGAADGARNAMMGGSYRQAATLLGNEASRAQADPVAGPHLRYLQGRALQLAEDHRGAVKVFERLLSDYPDSPWARKARFCRADSLNQLGDAAAAAQTYREETEALLQPERRDELAEIFMGYAHAAFEPDERKALPDYPTAQILFSTVLDLDPTDAVRHEAEHYLARAYVEQGNSHAAIEIFARRLDEEDDPMAAADRFHLAKAHAWNNTSEAIRQYHLVVRMHPDDPLAADALWEAALLQAPDLQANAFDPDRAVEDLRALVTTHPDHEKVAEAHLRIARVLEWNQRLEPAADAYRDFIDTPARTQVEEHPQAMVELARLLERLGDEEAAVDIYRRYSAEYPTHQEWAQVQIHLSDRAHRDGKALFRYGDLDAAVVAFEKHAEAHPAEDAEARYLIGMIRYQQGRLDEAITAFEAVASKYPYQWAGSRSEYALARIYLEERRDVDTAREHLDACIENGGQRSGECWTLQDELGTEGLDLYLERPLRTNEGNRVWMRARNLDKVELTLHRVDPEILMRKEGSVEAVDSLDVELIEPDKRWEVPIEVEAEGLTWAREIDLPVQQPGIYVIGATGKTLRAQVQVVVSDLTMAVHRQGGDVLVYVQDRRNGKPVGGARVLLSDGVTVYDEGRTDATGTWPFQLDPGDPTGRGTITALALKGRSMATATVSGYDRTLPEDLPVVSYVYTDRPAYRPGSSVGYRGLMHKVSDRRHESLAGASAEVTFKSPEGWVLTREKVKLDRFGSVGGEFRLEANADTGYYSIQIQVSDGQGGNLSYGSVNVQVTDAPPSRRQLQVDFDRPVYVLGDEVSATITAATYTGEPITGVKLLCNWGHEAEPFQTDPTDDEGHVVVRTSTLNRGGLGHLSLVARLPGEPVQVNAGAAVKDTEFDLVVELDRQTLRPGDAVHANLMALDHEGEGLATPLEISLHHTPQASVRPGYEGNPFARPLWEDDTERALIPDIAPPAEATRMLSLTTDGKGEAHASWELDSPGTYTLVAVGRDGRDRPVRSVSTVSVLGDLSGQQGLALLSEQTRLSARETARIQVIGPDRGTVLALVDADGIAAVHPARLAADGAEVAIPMELSYAPGVRVTVLAIRDDKVLSGTIDLTVDASLDVEVVGLPEESRPGDTVVATIEVKDEAGRPVDAQVSVAVIDAALLAQWPETRARADGLFLPAAHDMTSYNAEATMLRSVGPGAQIDAAILAEMQRLEEKERRRSAKAEAISPEEIDMYAELEEVGWLDDDMGFGGLGTSGSGAGGGGYGSGSGTLGGVLGGKAVVSGGMARQVERFRSESALWIDDLETGADGQATISIPLPDRSATWRVIAVAFDEGQRSGEAKEDLLARSPLSVTVAPPPFVREGDRPWIVADLISDAGGAFRWEGSVGGTAITPTDLELEPGRFQSLSLPGALVSASGATRTPAGDLLIPFDLRLEGAAGKTSDSLGSRLVLADRPLERWRSGRLDRSMEVTLQAPDGTTGDLQFVVEVAPGNLSGALALALAGQRLCWHSPYATANLAFASTALLDGAEGRLPAAQEEMVRSVAQAHIQELIKDRQTYGQVWSEPGRGHDGILTAHGYVALVRARRLALLPPGSEAHAQTKTDAARQRLLQQLRDSAASGSSYQAMLLYALSFEEGDDEAWSAGLTRMLRTAENTDAATMGRLAVAAVQFGMRDDAAHLRAPLEDALRAAMQAGNLDNTAVAAEGLAALDPGNPLLAEAAVAVEEGLERPWVSTGTVAGAVAALTRLRGASGPLPSSVQVTLPDGTSRKVDFTASPRAMRLEGTLPAGGDARIQLEPTGRGPVRYRAGLIGSPAEGAALPDDARLTIERRYRRPDVHYHGLPLPQGFNALSGRYTSWVDELEALPVGQRSRVELDICYRSNQERDPEGTVWILEEFLPGGAEVVSGSVSGVVHADIRADRIVAYLDGNIHCSRVRYELEGAVPGTWTSPAPLVRRLEDGQLFEVGEAAVIEVAPGPFDPPGDEPLRSIAGVDYPTGEFRLTPDELAKLGKRLSEEERWNEASVVLVALLEMGVLRNDRARQVAADLLQATIEIGDQKATLEAFELLKERDPAYPIPFDQIVAVAAAYEEQGEHRQAIRVYRTTLGARFLTEARLGYTLEQENLMLPSLRFVYDLTQAYPDLSQVESTLFHLPQIWADGAEQVAYDPTLKARGLTRERMLVTSADWMLEFAARYPESPLVEEAGFQLAGTYLELEDYGKAVSVSRSFARRHSKGQYLDSFLYMEGYARRAQGEMGAARTLFERVAEEEFTPLGGGVKAPSSQRHLALYSIAQIYDAEGKIKLAIDAYKEVSGRFRDAAEAVAQMEQVVLEAEEVTTIATIDDPLLALSVRNVDSANLLLYQVDLMRLYLREKNLSGVTAVRLAGIEPTHQRKVTFTGNRYRETEKEVPLPLRQPGAYLVVLKGEEVDLSAMVLFSDLNLQVQEDRNSGRVRVTVTDPAGRPMEDTHVKVIGSSSGQIVSGDTDLRGVFAAEGVHGIPTVIARHKEHYAFFSGRTEAPDLLQNLGYIRSPGKVDLLEDVRERNVQQRAMNRQTFFEDVYQSDIQGVSADQLE